MEGSREFELPVLVAAAERPQRPKPQTEEERAQVVACFDAIDSRGLAKGLELTLVSAGGRTGTYVYGTRMGFPTLEALLAVAHEHELKVSIVAEQFVANAAGLSLFGGGEGAPATYARFGLLLAPELQYMTDEEAELEQTPATELH